MAYTLVSAHGFIGAAIGFATLYVIYLLLMRLLVGRLTGFRFQPQTLAVIVVGYAALMSALAHPISGLVLAALSAAHAWRTLRRPRITPANPTPQ
jgi:hypothetical protein